MVDEMSDGKSEEHMGCWRNIVTVDQGPYDKGYSNIPGCMQDQIVILPTLVGPSEKNTQCIVDLFYFYSNPHSLLSIIPCTATIARANILPTLGVNIKPLKFQGMFPNIQ